MQPQTMGSPRRAPTESQNTALITLLADEDPVVYRVVRETILGRGTPARDWIRPYAWSPDRLLRSRAREILRQFEARDADVRFLAFCLRHGGHFDLETAGWLLAATAEPELSVEGYRALLDDCTAQFRPGVPASGSARQVLGAFHEFFFGELGFRGEEPPDFRFDNGYLNRVLDRRAGDPVHLVWIYLLLARRRRLPIAAIELPGYCLCRYQSSAEELYIDVFRGGRLMDKSECMELLVQPREDLSPEILAPASARRIVIRSCEHLHRGYRQLGSEDEALRIRRYLVALRA